MIQDHEVSESGKRARKCDDAVVDGVGVGAVHGGDFNAVGGRAATEPARDRAGHRPLEVAPKRLERKRRGLGDRCACREIAQRRLQLLLRRLQLSGELRVQIAFAIDVADEIVLQLLGA